jgi:hypothetical protein
MERNVDVQWVAIATRKRTVHLFAVDLFVGRLVTRECGDIQRESFRG